MKTRIISFIAAIMLTAMPVVAAPITDENEPAIKGLSKQGQHVFEMIDTIPVAEKLTAADEQTITTIRDAYAQLSEEEQALILNEERLTQAEAKIDTLKRQNWITYAITITEWTPSVDILLQRSAALVNDDTDTIVLEGPSGTSVQLNKSSASISAKEIYGSVKWETKDIKVELENCAAGVWKIKSPIPMQLSASQYHEDEEAAVEMTPIPEQSVEQPEEEKEFPLKEILSLAGIGAAAVAFLIVRKKLSSAITPVAKGDQPAKANATMSEEDEIEELRKKMASLDALYSDDPVDYNNPETEDFATATEREKTFTQEEIDNDITIEEIIEDEDGSQVIQQSKEELEQIKKKEEFFPANRFG